MTNPAPDDEELLKLLERSFSKHAGQAGQLDASELQRALGLTSPYLAKRILSALDRDNSGAVDRAEFLQGVRQLVFGSAREKLAFAFRLHDHDGDGFIGSNEMLRMISIGLAESEIMERSTQPAEYLTKVLFKAADANQDGRISLDEFVSAVESHPRLLRQLSRSEAVWLVPNEALLERIDVPHARTPRPKAFLVNHGWAPVVCLILWAAVNIGLFCVSWLPAVNLRAQDPVMQLGRAIGLCIDFNGALILVPMARRLLTRLRSTFAARWLPIDDAIPFHRIVGHGLFWLSLAHAGCFTLAYVNGHPKNLVTQLFFGTLYGATGAVLIFVIALMWVFSLAVVRRTRHFELFYFSHWLYVAWLVITIVHSPSFLIGAGVPILAFGAEQIIRLSRRAQSCRVASSRALRSGVTRLELERPAGFDFNPADYVFLRIPAIAKHEWHPFTLSSAPERNRLSVHVRALGNWSRALRSRVEEQPNVPLTAYVDGPYGSPSAHIFESKVAVLIGAGIGVTPFASVLESLVMRANGESQRLCKLEKAYFFWLNRDQYSFEWFSALLADLEKLDRRGLLEMHLCMTGARTGATAMGLELARELMHNSGRSDIVTGLRIHTHLGPPDWNEMLQPLVERHGGSVAYFCGPPGLAKKISKHCRRLGMSFREERF